MDYRRNTADLLLIGRLRQAASMNTCAGPEGHMFQDEVAPALTAKQHDCVLRRALASGSRRAI
jgi:hypothetical protein